MIPLRLNVDGDALHKIHCSLLIATIICFVCCLELNGPQTKTPKKSMTSRCTLIKKKRAVLSVEGTHYRSINA